MTVSDIADVRDRDLMTRIASGDQEAFKALFNRYGANANALAFRLVRQSHLAEEIVQEAFLAVWRKPASYVSDRGTVRAWLMSLVHNRGVDLVRREEANRRRSEVAAADPVDPPADLETTVVDAVDRPKEQDVVRNALQKIPPEQRQVIELMYFGGLSQSKIAEQLGIPLGTVKSRTLLAMRRMRSDLIGLER